MHRLPHRLPKQAMVATCNGMAQQRNILQYAASHPVEMVAGLGVATTAVTAASYRIYTLQLTLREQTQMYASIKSQKEKEHSLNERLFAQKEEEKQKEIDKLENRIDKLEGKIDTLQLTLQEQTQKYASMKSQKENEHSLNGKNERLFAQKEKEKQKEIEKLEDKIDKLEGKIDNLQELKIGDTRERASIQEKGKAGEVILKGLLEDFKDQDIIKGFEIQPSYGPKRPDAVAEIVDGVYVVIDSKAPDESLDAYIRNLQNMVLNLSGKHYNTIRGGTLRITLMLLPSEHHLQEAYKEGKDEHGLHNYAKERKVLILSPNGLRAVLQAQKVSLEEQKGKAEQTDNAGDIVTKLEPLWNDKLLPAVKTTSKLLIKVVSEWNSIVDAIHKFEKVQAEVLSSKKKKTRVHLPETVMAPKDLTTTMLGSKVPEKD